MNSGSLGDDFDPLYSQRLRESDPIRKLNRYIEGGPGSGPHKVGDRVIRNPKISKKWKDTPEMRDHNHGTVVSVDKEGVHVRTDADDKILKDPNADKWDKKHAEKGTFYQHGELVSEKKSKESKREAIESFGKSFQEGGSGSGNFGHSGRPGEVGGAGAGGEAPPKKERKKGYKIGEKYGLVGVKPGFKVDLAKEMFGGRHYKDLKYAEKKQVKEALRARGIIRPKGATEASGNEKALQEAKVLDSKKLGGGIEDTSKVSLEGGLTGVFKISGGGASKEAEVASWQIAKIVGLEDIHPPTVFREIGGQKGSMQQFWQGTLASKVSPAENKWDGEKDLARAAAFDYIIGNSDRHSHNWLVDQGNNKLQLIDHGRAFPSREFTVQNAHHTMFVRKLASEDSMYGLGGKPYKQAAMSPKEAAAPYVENKDKILEALKETGIKEEAIKGVGNRIDRLARKDKWSDL